ncbi:MAG: AAA family ATPase [Candidatus Marinimicrobia bacterium]|nr:AAA family ATPase [Candidatus Neomarinimicrobiota bacterium]MCF7839525.1 AAA family ATPase [Candidatus Neomarinimicrobiota bacterium]
MNYYELIGLEKEPFSMTPDPDFYFEAKHHTHCVDRLEISLRLARGLNIVVGGIGLGKTTLSRYLLSRFSDFGRDFKFFLVIDPGFESNLEFIQYIARLFGIRITQDNVMGYMNVIEHFLIDMSIEANKQIVLIIDEGQKMGADQLELIRSLLNFETNQKKLIQVVILAQPEFRETLNSMPNLKDRVAMSYTLQPLDREESKQFIDYRLRVAAHPAPEELFTDDAKEMIYTETQGYPRKMVVLCHNLLLEMLMAKRESVTANMVNSYLSNKQYTQL